MPTDVAEMTAARPDPRIDQINAVGAEIIGWIREAYPDVPKAADIARDAIALFIGGMQEPELLGVPRHE